MNKKLLIFSAFFLLYSFIANACPTVTSFSAEVESLCQGDAPDFSTAASTISFTDPNSQALGITWYRNVNLTDVIDETNYSLPHSGSCAAETVVVYAGIRCSNGNPIAAGKITVNVYPSPTTAAPTGGCSLVVQDNCDEGDEGDLIVQYSENGGTSWDAVPSSNPIQGETLDWRAFVSSTPDNDGDGNPDCSQTGMVTANCTGCPTASAFSAEVENLCEGDKPNFANAENKISINDPNGQSLGIAWYSDVSRQNAIDVNNYVVSHSGNCTVGEVILYAGIRCSSTPDNPIPAGIITVNVYPTPISAAPIGTCSLEVVDNCTVGELLIQYSDDNGVNWDAVPNTNPVEGDELLWRAFVSGAPDNDGDGNPDCVQTGTVTATGCTGCPSLVSNEFDIINSTRHCWNGEVDIETIIYFDSTNKQWIIDYSDTSVWIHDPNFQFDEIQWYTNFGLTNEFTGYISELELDESSCNIQNIDIYIGAKCKIEVTPILRLGQMNITVYPNPWNAVEGETINDCNLELRFDEGCGSDNLQFGVQYRVAGSSDAFTDENPIPYPFDHESTEWRAYVIKVDGDSCFSEVTQSIPENCPQAGCPYPVIEIQEGTTSNPIDYSDFNPLNGPVVLLCTFPEYLNEGVGLSELTYQWGYQDSNGQFIALDDSVRTPNMSFYVVSEKHDKGILDGDLRNYGIQVNNGDCQSTNFYRGIGKKEESLFTKDTGLHLFPNPNKGSFELSIIHPDFMGKVAIKIYNSVGKIVEQEMVLKEKDSVSKLINLQNRADGMYLIEVILDNQERFLGKVIVY